MTAVVPHPPLLAGEVGCAREGCGDGYTAHEVGQQDGAVALAGACAVDGCPCPGFLWVPPAGPVPEDRAP